MNEIKNSNEQKTRIISQIAELSRHLGMVPSDDTITMSDPVIENSMDLSNWLSTTRDSFFKLSLLISKALEIRLQ